MNKSLSIAPDQKKVFSQRTFLKAPSFVIEYTYYVLLFYVILGDAWGVTVRLVGPGVLAGLAILCLMHFGQGSAVAFRPIMLALGCAISALVIQLGLHQESFGNNQVRTLVIWAVSLIVVQAISWRKGFLHRFALVAFLIGCGTLPYLKTYGPTDEVIRLGVSREVGLANPTALGMWFGFCAIYFLIRGLETRNYMVRIASWSAGLLSIYMVAITVSRGPMLGVAIAAVLAAKKVLKRSFLPILVILCLSWLIYLSGLVDTLVGYYVHRGAEETGRSYLWKFAFRAFLDAWWGGVGVSSTQQIPTPSGNISSPHNGLLFIGMSSGIIPLVFFVGYLVRVARGAYHVRTQNTPHAPYILPLCAFAFLEIMINGTVFMSPWVMLAFSMAMAADESRARQPTLGKKPRLTLGRGPTGIS